MTEKARLVIANATPNPSLYAALFAQPLMPREEFVPCIIWPHGKSGGRPIMRVPKYPPRHPVNLFYDCPARINRVCQTKLCVNPYHYVIMPRPPGTPQHPLVFEAEEVIERFMTLDQAYEGIDMPRHYVLAAWRNHRQLGMKYKPLPSEIRQ